MSFYVKTFVCVVKKSSKADQSLLMFQPKSVKKITFMGIGLVGCHRCSTLLIGIIPFFMCVLSVTVWCILTITFQFSEYKRLALLFLRFS